MSQETSCFTRFSENPEGIKNVFHAIFSTVYIYIYAILPEDITRYMVAVEGKQVKHHRMVLSLPNNR